MYLFSFVIKVPNIDPEIKLTPKINPTGNSTDSYINKFTFFLLKLFCKPIISRVNNIKLNINENNIFLNR